MVAFMLPYMLENNFDLQSTYGTRRKNSNAYK